MPNELIIVFNMYHIMSILLSLIEHPPITDQSSIRHSKQNFNMKDEVYEAF